MATIVGLIIKDQPKEKKEESKKKKEEQYMKEDKIKAELHNTSMKVKRQVGEYITQLKKNILNFNILADAQDID